jgi:hypothetical protein
METYSISPTAIGAEVGKSLIILNTASLKYFEASGAGTRIWGILQNKPATTDEIVDVLLSEFEVEESHCRSAVNAFLGQALALGLISV